MKLGNLVRFVHERDGGPVRRVVSVMSDGMIQIHDMSGYFAPHLFVPADDVGDIPRVEATPLKPCPFCGAPAELERDSDHHGEWFNLGCSRHYAARGVGDGDGCIGGRLFYTAPLDEEAAAIAQWNARAAPDGA